MKQWSIGPTRWFAVRTKRGGYAMEFYETERAGYLKEFGKFIIGDFATEDEAHKAIERALNEED
jgi:septal ring-binding cell division protein DamX